METKVIAEVKNPFLGRDELTVEISVEDMPTKDALVESLGKDKELVDIRGIKSNFGRGTFVGDVVVYDSKESKDKYMTIPKKVRAKMEADRKAAEEAAKKAAAAEAEAKAAEEEKPADEKPEEKTEDVKEDEAAPEGVPSEESKE